MASFKILFEVTYLSHNLGITSIATGTTAALILAPLSAKLSQRKRHQQTELSKAHASLSNLISEALQGLRRIRLSSMERIWQRRMINSRAQELEQIWKSEITLACLTLVANLGPMLLASAALSVYSFRVGHLSPSMAFASLRCFDNLHDAFRQLPLKAAALNESWISYQRVKQYLDGPEQTPSAIASDSINLESATLAWSRNSNTELSEATDVKLRDVHLAFPKGKLSIVTGKTGSGKSLLLASMLEEAVIQAGYLGKPMPPDSKEKDMPVDGIVPGMTALVSQPPWIENCSIRDNILFGHVVNEARYHMVLHACALDEDLSMLPDGDATKAGVNGAVLSGGQKWRVALARALYSPAEILILEDVLSAVDVPVAQWLCERALTGELVEGRTRILVTHHPDVCLPAASYVVAVENGTAIGHHKPENKIAQGISEMTKRTAQTVEKAVPKPVREKSSQTVYRTKRQLLWSYIQAAGGIRSCLLCILVTLASQASSASHTWWLTRWTTQPEPVAKTNMKHNTIVYLFLSLGNGAALVMQSLVFSSIGLAASRTLFRQMVMGVLGAPLVWIDGTPMSNVLHSLGGDMYQIDHRTTLAVVSFLSTVVHLLFIMLTR